LTTTWSNTSMAQSKAVLSRRRHSQLPDSTLRCTLWYDSRRVLLGGHACASSAPAPTPPRAERDSLWELSARQARWPSGPLQPFKQSTGRTAKPFSEHFDRVYRRVRDTCLNSAHVGPRKAALIGKSFLGQSGLLSQLLYPGSKANAKCQFHRRIVRQCASKVNAPIVDTLIVT
jgi:hypothetical protein